LRNKAAVSDYILKAFSYFCPMSKNSEIKLSIGLDDEKVPQKIEWLAADGGVDKPKEAKAFMLSIWDGAENTALRIDLWTKKMMVDEMNDFFFQTMMTMADTYGRATNNTNLVGEMKQFAQDMKTKMETEMQKDQL